MNEQLARLELQPCTEQLYGCYSYSTPRNTSLAKHPSDVIPPAEVLHRRFLIAPLAHSALFSSQLPQGRSIERHNAFPSQILKLRFNQTPPLKANPTPINDPSSLPLLPPLPPTHPTSSLPLRNNGRPPRTRRLRPTPAHRLSKRWAEIRSRNQRHGELRAQLQD